MEFIRTARSTLRGRFVNVGFTLVELLTTVSVASILTFVAVPSYNSFVETNRLATATNDFIADLNVARIEAIKRQKGNSGVGRMIVCSSSSGAGCTSTAWQTGWIMFWDDNGDGAYTAGGNDLLLKAHESIPANNATTTTPANTSALIFNKNGALITTITDVRIANSKINKTNKICLNGGTGRAMLANNGVTCS
jgi:type IV fimbrial biogenesis protein FimT